MDYTKDIILNLSYKRLNDFRNRVKQMNHLFKRMKEITLMLLNILKKWLGSCMNLIKNNIFISTTLFVLIILMIADFILVDNFMKIFTTLY